MNLERLQGSSLDGGRFRLEELLGQGGYGAVFRATQTSMGRTCALKVLHAKFIEADNVVGRFRAEARATSSLRHPNTVVIYDYGQDDGQGLFYIAMEFLEGKSLNELIKDRKRLELDVTVKLVEQIARSLQDAHDKKIVHRDIKPHNVMVVRQAGEPYFVKVIDFGIAKITHGDNLFEGTKEMQLTQSGTMIGTPLYMAPEQIREGGEVDGRTDMYALGMCIYKMLLGHTPYQGMETWEVIGKHMSGPPRPLRYYDPQLPVSDDFERVVLRALQKEKEDRYPTILEFARALSAVCERDGLLHGGAVTGQHDTMLLPSVDATTPMPSRRDEARGPHVPREDRARDVYEATQVPVEPRRDPLETAQRDARRFKTSRTEAIPGGVQPHRLATAQEEDRTVAGVLTPREQPSARAGRQSVNTGQTDTAHAAIPRQGRDQARPGDETGTMESSYPERGVSQRRLLMLSAALIVSVLFFFGVIGVVYTLLQQKKERARAEIAQTTATDTPGTPRAVPTPVEERTTPPSPVETASMLAAITLASDRVQGAQQRATADVASHLAEEKRRAEAATAKKDAQSAQAPKSVERAPASSVENKPPAPSTPRQRITQATDFVVIPYGDLYVDGKKVSGKGKRTLQLDEGSHSAYVIKDGKKSPVRKFKVEQGKREQIQFKVFNL